MQQSGNNRLFLIQCRQLAANLHQNDLNILQDGGKQHSKQKNMIVQYIKCLNNKKIPSKKESFSLPALFAYMQLYIDKGDKLSALNFLQSRYREQIDREILIYNIAKLHQMNNSYKKSVFWYELLLKQNASKKQLYAYNYIVALISEGRKQEAFQITKRYLSHDKPMIEQVFLRLLKQRPKQQIIRALDAHFNSRILPLQTIFNIGLITKKILPEQSELIFEQLCTKISNNEKMSNKMLNLLLKAKINLLNIYSTKNIEPTKQSLLQKKSQMKSQIVDKCINIYVFLSKHVQLSLEIETQIEQMKNYANLVSSNLRAQNVNNNFLGAIFNQQQKRKSQIKSTHSFTMDENSNHESKSENLRNKSPKNKDEYSYQFSEKRKRNSQKLKFLMSKQKELHSFFKNIRVFKEKNIFSIRNIGNCGESLRKDAVSSTRAHQKIKDLQNYQRQFQAKRTKYQLQYKNSEFDQMLYELLDQWKYKDSYKIRNNIIIEKVKKFVFSLDNEKQNQNYNVRLIQPKGKTSSIQNSKRTSKKSSGSSSKIRKNTSCEGSSKMIKMLKPNDKFYSKFADNLINNQQDKKQQKSKHTGKNFEQMLGEAQKYEISNELEKSHEILAKMYKMFKGSKQKQTTLIKIAKNFTKLGFDEEAEKTYIKCTKMNNAEAFYRLGSLQIKNGAIQQGIENLEKANCLERHNIKIQIKLVHAYSILEETIDRALSLANSILQKNPYCLEALILTAKILQKKGKIKEALQIALVICSIKSSPAIYHYVGLLYLQDSNINEAFKFFQLAIQSDPEHIPSLIQLATLISETNPKQCIQILQKTISLDPTNQIAYARLGKVYEIILQDYQSALSVYKKGLEIEQNYETYIKIGDCYYKKGLNYDALMNFNKALYLKGTTEIYEKLGQVHQKQKQPKKAIQSYSCALEKLNKQNSTNQKRKKILIKLGNLLINSQDFEGAYRHLIEVLEIQQSFEVYKMLGHACFGKGDYNQSLSYFKEALSMIDEDNLEILQNIAMCFDRKEEYMTSKQIYEKILKIDPKNIKCLNNLANIFLIVGKTNQAFYWFQFMMQQIPNNIEKRLRVVDIYATIGDWSKVEQHLLICAKQKQNDIRVLERMVNLYKEKRDTKLVNKFQKKLAFFKQNKQN